MNKTFTRLATLTVLSLAPAFAASATDLLVGPSRTYATISDAVAAASDGDRILVKPKTALYTETVTITKSLTILSSDEGVYFKCGGTWTFAPATAGKSLTIVGLHLTGGDIQASAAAPAGTRSAIRVLGSVLNGSRISFPYSNFDVTAAADSIIGEVNIQFGKVMGNYIDAYNYTEAIDVTPDGTATTDSIWVVGNRIRQAGNNYATISFNTNRQYIFCANNYLQVGTSPTFALGITMTSPLGTGTGKNVIVNNTVFNYSSSGYGNYSNRYAIYLTNPTDNVLVLNNLLLGTQPTYGGNAIVQSGGSALFALSYNYMRSSYYIYATAASNGVGNNINSSTLINTSSGLPLAGDAINGGAPDDEFIDTDLTPNDVGCYGGSYSLANFRHPTAYAGNLNNIGGRTYFFAAPRVLMQGQPVKVRAAGFDR